MLEYSISLVHTLPWFLTMLKLKVDNHDDCSDFLEEQPAALLSVYYGKSVVLVVLILSQEATKQLALLVVIRNDPV